MNFDEWKQQIKGKKVAVIGIGVSNLPLIRILVSCGAVVCTHDERRNIAKKTLRNAKEALGIKSKRENNQWYWSLD